MSEPPPLPDEPDGDRPRQEPRSGRAAQPVDGGKIDLAGGPAVRELELDGPIEGPENVGPRSQHSDVEQQTESFRQILAGALIGILFFEVLFATTATWLPALFGKPNVPLDTFREVMTIIFGPTIALVGSATGFYFGERSRVDAQRVASAKRTTPPPRSRARTGA